MIPPRHPSQLYEAALEGALLLAFMQWRVWKTNVLRTQPGRLCGEYMVSYAANRREEKRVERAAAEAKDE